ncbi:MAG: recombination mediator RecR [Saprospiraceae bacterium]
MNFSSKLIERTVEAFASLPGIGRKTAFRLTLHLLRQDKAYTAQFAEAVLRMREEIRECDLCHNYSDHARCEICSSPLRDKSLICVVENVRALMAIEDTGQYKGLYHVLGGLISPIDGVTPADLNIDTLAARAGDVQEIIMAISPTIEGETTAYYIARQVAHLPVRISAIARGVAFGGDLEYADELTLGRSIIARTPYASRQGE